VWQKSAAASYCAARSNSGNVEYPWHGTYPASTPCRLGVAGQGWFLGFHCLTKYVKVVFFRGTSLRPLPPARSKYAETRYLNVHEDDQLDEAQMATWAKQAAVLPGWVP
jgi:hypothetical protein